MPKTRHTPERKVRLALAESIAKARLEKRKVSPIKRIRIKMRGHR